MGTKTKVWTAVAVLELPECIEPIMLEPMKSARSGGHIPLCVALHV
jgi:hypothetical protein